MRRRALLAGLPLGLTAFAGCSVLSTGSETSTPTDRPTATRTATPAADLPYVVDGNDRLEKPHGFAIENRTDEDRYVTVVVEHDERTVFYRNVTIPADDNVAFERLVGSAGTFRIVVETAGGERREQTWLVSPNLYFGLTVALEADGIHSNQQLACTPDCPVLDAGGTSVDLPYRPEDRDGGRNTALCYVENVADEARRVGVRVAFEGTKLLDYEYELPPGIRIMIPISSLVGVYDLAVSFDGATREYDWHVPEERSVYFHVGDEIRPHLQGLRRAFDDGFQGLRFDEIRSAADRPQDVAVTVDADGDRVVDKTVTTDPNGETPFYVEAPAEDRVHLELELETGARIEATWTVCLATGTLSLDVEDDELYLMQGERLLRRSRTVGGEATWTSGRETAASGDGTPHPASGTADAAQTTQSG